MVMENRISDMEMLRMQALSILQVPHPFLVSDEFAPTQEKLDPYCSTEQQNHNNAEKYIEEQEFSFSCNDSPRTFMFADEIFVDGQIRPIFPTFNQSHLITTTQNNDAPYLRPPLKKIFVQQTIKSNSKLSGVSNELRNDNFQNMTLVEMEASNECYGKRNSTGFSKVWRFRRDLKHRSNSDHKDAFVFFNPPVMEKSNKEKVENIIVKKRNAGKNKRTLSPHEMLYVMNRMRKESNKRRSFLPYKQQLYGIFTNRNGLSRNLHPF